MVPAFLWYSALAMLAALAPAPLGTEAPTCQTSYFHEADHSPAVPPSSGDPAHGPRRGASLLQVAQSLGTKAAGARGPRIPLSSEASLALNKLLRTTPEALEFVHIPKNAGMAIEWVGVKYGIKWAWNALPVAPDLRDLAKLIMPDGNECTWHHVPPPLLPGLTLYEGRELFVTTRSPYDRLVSEYTWLMQAGQNNRSALSDWQLISEKPLCSPAGLNNMVKKALAGYIKGERWRFDCHLIPQSEYIWDTHGRQLCSDIIRLSDLPEAFNTLMEKKGLNARMSPQKGNSFHHLCNLTSADLFDDTKVLIQQVYADDFRKLNYSM